MIIKEKKNFLSKESISFIQNTVLSNGFPFYFVKSSVLEKEDKSMCHIVLKRPQHRKIDELYNSPFYKETLQILHEFFKASGIKYSLFTRICYNLSYNNNFDKCGKHKDHEFPHKQIIIYLDFLDKGSSTVIVSNGKEKIIKPEKFKGVCFENFDHYFIYPKFGHRLVLVATFI